MKNTAQALYEFWSGFDIPAFVEGHVPEEAQLPYITYSLTETEPLEASSHYARLWYRDTGLGTMLTKVDEIKETVKQGVTIPCTGGYVAIRPGSPLVQTMQDQDRTVQYAYFNLQLNCYHT